MRGIWSGVRELYPAEVITTKGPARGSDDARIAVPSSTDPRQFTWPRCVKGTRTACHSSTASARNGSCACVVINMVSASSQRSYTPKPNHVSDRKVGKPLSSKHRLGQNRQQFGRTGAS